MVEIVFSIAAKVSEYLVSPIGHQLKYLFNYHSNVEDLKRQLDNLGDVKGRVDRDVAAAKRNGDEIEPDVEKWLKSVNEIDEEAAKFLENEDKANKRCFNGLCPNLKSRYQLNKKAKKTTEEIVKIQGDGKFDRVSYPAPPQGIRSTLAKGYEAFESRTSTFKEIIEALRIPNINLIGVYGMAGVGKTTLVKEIAKQAKEDKLVDEVVMAVVSETPNLKTIQGEIADMLGLKFDRETESGRASQLCKRLMKEKILVILDDIWGRLDLEAVGIPLGDDRVHHKEQMVPLKMAGNSIEDPNKVSEIKGCKVLLTSRNQDVLYNQMDTQKNFEIGVLLEQEAWNLFKKMAGDCIEDPDLQPTAIEVAKTCACLPIAVVTVAKALKNKSLFVWKDALQQLHRSNPTNIMGMHADVYSSLELSYNHLENEEVKSFFLLCGLLRDAITIGHLLKYGMGLRLFRGINTMEEARDRVYTLVHKLKTSCLFLDSDIGSVKMHDVVLDVAIAIASRDQNGFMVSYGVGLKEWPKDIQKKCTAISLPHSNIHELPQWLEYPELKFLFLRSNDPTLKIPDTFFKEMKELKVLDLTGIHFSSLPSSVHFLANLQTLCLDFCVLGDLAKISELKNLEILSFMGSDIVELPREIAQLTHLRSLDLTNCSKLQVIPPNVISSLSRLEDLHMENSFVQWELQGPNDQIWNASLVELKNLSCLRSLEVHIPDAKVLPKGLLFENLIRYRILVGDVWDWSGDNESSRRLKLKLNTSIHLEDGVNMLLKRTEDLYLDRLMGIKNLLSELDRDGFRQLKHLHVQSNPEIQYIINSMEWVPCIAFPILESLFLSNLTDLQEICHGHLPMECHFRKLRVVEVECCHKLKNLFLLSLARGLLQLQDLKITDCKIMDGIVAEGREDNEDKNEAVDNTMFPQLRYLTLQCLPKLISFWSNMKTMPFVPFKRQKLSTTDAGSMEIISESEHDIPLTLFDKKVSLPSLEFLKLSELSKLKQIWHGQPPAESCNLRHLVVEKCALLLNVVSSNLLQSLHNLVLITVESCDSVEQVFDLEELNCSEEHAGLLSHLDELNLIKLPKLRCIWGKDPQGILRFQNLKWLKIQKCNSLRNLFCPSIALDLVQLRGLNISDCLMMEEIVENDDGAKEEEIDKIVFPLLTDIILEGLPNLTSFYPGNKIFECPFLKEMTIAGGPKLKTFTSTSKVLQETFGEGDLDIHCAPLFNEKVAFPNLEKLIITSVLLKEIWHSQLHIGSFCKLKYLKIESCHHLLNIVPSNMLMRLQNLESLIVFSSRCSIEYIFDLGGLNNANRHVVRATQLSNLDLHYLPGLKKIWKKDSQGIFPFQKLSSLDVYGCSNLRNIFTTSIAKSLAQLQKLSIQSCGMVEEIVEKEGVGEEATYKIVFPQLTSMRLADLWKLKSFCQGVYISEWPFLNKLEVSRCYDVEIFASELISIEGTPTKKSLFLVDKCQVAFPNLEKLELYYMFSMTEIWQSQFHARSFCKLRVLNVKGCQLILKVFPTSLLQNLENLEELSVESCEALVEVFELEEVAGEVGYAAILPNLRVLRLTKLPKLMHLLKKDSQLSQVFQNLTILEVSFCGSLTHLLPSTIAKSLVQMKSISIYNCKMMEEIIASVEGEATIGTTFSQLNSLRLRGLPNLESFCAGSNTFSFTSLEEVFVEGCPKLKNFSHGILSTPKLEKVCLHTEWFKGQVVDKWVWKGDLNSTIQHLFAQKVQAAASST